MLTTVFNQKTVTAQKQSKLHLIFFKSFSILFSLLLWAGSLQAQFRLVGLTATGGSKGGGTAFNMLSNGTGYTVSNTFTSGGGRNPVGGLVQGADGAFYGMMPEGGTSNYGTIFKVTAAGAITIIKNFDYTSGSEPNGSLIRATDGNFYGMTSGGGTHGYGIIFKLTSGGTFTVLKNLHRDTTGSNPTRDLVQATDGSFYGMTSYGGANNQGTVFKITSSGTFTLLKSFDGTTTGGRPYGSLVQGTDGALYGMTYQGGTSNTGVIFKITTGGTLTVLKNLDNASGRYPYGSLTKGTDGAFYGMTNSGGSGYGTIFRVTQGGTFLLQLNLDGGNTGAYPRGSFELGTDGLLYGMTYGGGAYGRGTIFKYAIAGTFTKLEDLASGTNSGYNPYYGTLEQGTDGAFYGMTYQGGGTANGGTIFKITSAGTFTLLAKLPEDQAGYNPVESLVQATDGYYYGTAKQGGRYGNGVAYKLCTSGAYTVLHSFDANTTGQYPEGSLMQAKDGNFYGTTTNGGGNGYGTIFRLTPAGVLTVIADLDEATGFYTYGSLVAGDDTTLYGMAYRGGTEDRGTIFKVTTSGEFMVIKNLDATTGYYPYGSLLKAKDGAFYGMTHYGGSSGNGTIFKVTTSGSLTVLRNLAYATGARSYGGNLIQAYDGNLYGMIYDGGTNSRGVVFKISTSGTYTVLKNFDNTTTGGYPRGSLVQGSDSLLYGMTTSGGTYNGGTIFKILPSGGSFAVLRHLNPATDGSTPYGALVIQKSAPKATAQSVTTVEDSARSITIAGTGGTPLTYAVTTAPKNGALTGTAPNLIYTPNANYNGKDSFYFNVTWGCQTSSSAKVTITISQVNDAPVLAPIGNKTIARGSPLTFTATATDVDAGQTKTFSLIGAPAGPTIGATSGAFSWTPAATGTFTFKVRVTDNGSPVLFDEETITVTVTGSALRSVAVSNDKTHKQLEEDLALIASPNPSRTYFTLLVKSNRNEKVMLRITDAVGRTIDVRNAVIPNSTLTFGSKYLPGTYLVQAQQGGKKVTLKLIKQ